MCHRATEVNNAEWLCLLKIAGALRMLSGALDKIIKFPLTIYHLISVSVDISSTCLHPNALTGLRYGLCVLTFCTCRIVMTSALT